MPSSRGGVPVLRQQSLTGAPEYALAAFNAGEDRIAAWRAERDYEEIAELVESIPFTGTQDHYVQIVLRNAEVYRMIYGPGSPPASTAAVAPAAPALAPTAFAASTPEAPIFADIPEAADPSIIAPDLATPPRPTDPETETPQS